MPYVNTEARYEIGHGRLPQTKGELTYVIYKAMMRWLENGDAKNFDRRADAITAVECAKLEFYRRHVGPYEDGAIARNGDVT